LDSIVANQENTLAQDHEGIETLPDPMPGEIKIPRLAVTGKQAGSQGPGIRDKISLKPLFSGPLIGQQASLAFRERNDRPLVKNRLFVPGVHLLGTALHKIGSFRDGHNQQIQNSTPVEQLIGHV
jgi:hypothetical protein